MDDAAGGSSKLKSLLNACGYFVAFGSDAAFRPSFFSGANKWRYRLFQFLQPTDKLEVYNSGAGANPLTRSDWFLKPLALAKPPIQPLADNVIALIVLPKRANDGDGSNPVLCPDFLYDTRGAASAADPKRNQLPPMVDIVLVAVDEPTAQRWNQKYGQVPPPLGLENLFIKASLDNMTFQQLDQDLKTLENTLRNLGANYRIFKTTVLIQESKWSEP